jgi:hypothetical protein
MDGPTCHRALRRYWFPLPKRFGIGVTAASEAEARALAADVLARHYPEGLTLDAVIVDVDIRTLDQGHVVTNIGPPSVRGVWYPALNLS